jgi:hypothetical protein
MSDLNDLIHTNASIAYNQGVLRERERIVSTLEEEKRKCEQAGLFANDPILRDDLQKAFIGLQIALALIKGEQL